MDTKQIYKILSIGLVQLTTQAIAILISIAMFIKGWGLTVQSWGWVIGASLVLGFVTWACTTVTMLLFKGGISDE